MKIICNMLLQVFLLFSVLTVVQCDNFPLVTTPLGDVCGYYKTSQGGKQFSAFEGIPFAKPPIGDRRFEEPEPAEPWIGVWNATSTTVCAQTSMSQPNLTVGDEDCLHINVYVPRISPESADKLDVIVHIHGGAFLYYSGHSYAHPFLLMDHEVVFVTFNYRLGVLGFLSTEDDIVPGNNGLKDQTLALKWIQENIQSFGGNPKSVTITGLSAGAGSVHLHYFSEMSRGLFHRGFSQSGVALNPWATQEEPLMRAKKLAQAVGCPPSQRELVECLKQRPYKHILKRISVLFSYRFMPAVPFGPVVEKGGSRPFLNQDPYTLLKRGQVYDVPWIASMTSHEGLFPVRNFVDDLDYLDQNWDNLAPDMLEFNYTLSPSLWKSTAQKIKTFYFGEESINKQNVLKFVQVFSDRAFFNEGETAVRLQAKVTNSSVYFYTFSYPGDNNAQKTVGHGEDTKYFFTPVLTQHPLTQNELKMSDLLLGMLISFAKTGKPTFGDVEWKPTKFDELTYLSISGTESGEVELKTTQEWSNRSFWNLLQFLEGENLISLKTGL